MTTQELENLADLLAKMKPGPYEYWDQAGNDLIAAECQIKGTGKLIAALPGLTGMKAEFTAITALLNAAPELIEIARRNTNQPKP